VNFIWVVDNRQQPQQQQGHIPTSQMTNVQSYATVIPNASTSLAGKLINPFRVTPNNKQQTTHVPTSMNPVSYSNDKPAQTVMSAGAGRTFTRVLSNVRSVNVLPNQNIGVLGDGATLLNQGGSGLKRIRILATASIPTSKASLNSIPTRFDGSQSDIGNIISN